jgi:hypothetical protein
MRGREAGLARASGTRFSTNRHRGAIKTARGGHRASKRSKMMKIETSCEKTFGMSASEMTTGQIQRLLEQNAGRTDFCLPLFGRFLGTMASSDFSSACMLVSQIGTIRKEAAGSNKQAFVVDSR